MKNTANNKSAETLKSTMHTDSRAVCFTSETDEWPTPPFLVEALRPVFPFTLDPCATVVSAKAPRFFTREVDGLAQSWANEIVWMNPPYGLGIKFWMAKARHSALHEGATVVCLVPARTDTAWWHEYVMPADNHLVFIRGKLTFGDAVNPAPFPSVLVVMRPHGSEPFPPFYLSGIIREAQERHREEKRDLRRRKIVPFVNPPASVVAKAA